MKLFHWFAIKNAKLKRTNANPVFVCKCNMAIYVDFNFFKNGYFRLLKKCTYVRTVN